MKSFPFLIKNAPKFYKYKENLSYFKNVENKGKLVVQNFCFIRDVIEAADLKMVDPRLSRLNGWSTFHFSSDNRIIPNYRREQKLLLKQSIETGNVILEKLDG